MVPWSPRRLLAEHLGCDPDALHVVARSDAGDTVAVTYETPDGEQVTVLAVAIGNLWRITARHDDRWLRAETALGRELRW